jgi:membrane-bound lytic murein transglycosylase
MFWRKKGRKENETRRKANFFLHRPHTRLAKRTTKPEKKRTRTKRKEENKGSKKKMNRAERGWEDLLREDKQARVCTSNHTRRRSTRNRKNKEETETVRRQRIKLRSHHRATKKKVQQRNETVKLAVNSCAIELRCVCVLVSLRYVVTRGPRDASEPTRS